MQVSHVNEFVTHAVIGGGETIDFGISSSAEFYNILSSTLYKDQILAVVRETLCNAWDAHIEAGCTHIPVEITLTADKFTIKDSGHGIHRNDMGPVYGTYGNSTKKNDGTQTGGFGLGCKAPFAYTDHFEVISNYDGVKTIYNLSKSSAQAQGKPGIVPIASFPTTDKGLQVSIAIHNKTDQQRFRTLIRRIVCNGDMNMTLNGAALTKLGFDTGKANYLIKNDVQLLDSPTDILVRYGNVIYPVDCVDALRESYRRISSHLNDLSRGVQRYSIIFQAPPHSISVTPSRESLSMQEHTVKTLQTLFTGFITMLDSGFANQCDQHTQVVVNMVAKESRGMSALLSTAEQLPSTGGKFAPTSINDLESMAQRYMQVNYPSSKTFRKKDITWRLQAMVDNKLLDRGLVQTFLRELHGDSKFPGTSWLQRRVIAPLLVKLQQAKLDTNRLFAYDPTDTWITNAYPSIKGPPLIPARSIAPENLYNALPYLRNIIVLSTSTREIKERADYRDEFKKMGGYSGFLFYHLSAKKADREAELAFFNNSGMLVIDLTIKTVREAQQAAANSRTSAPRKPKQEGLVSLLSVRHASGKGIDTRLSKNINAPRIAQPEFVVQLSVRKDEYTNIILHGLDMEASGYVLDLFGTKGGIMHNSVIQAKWLQQGAQDMVAYLIEKVSAEMLSNPRIHEYWAFDVDRAIDNIGGYFSYADLIRIAYATPAVRKEFGLISNLTGEDKKYVYLYKKLTHFMGVSPVVRKLKSIKLHPANGALTDRFIGNDRLKAITHSYFKILLESTTSKPHHIAAATQYLIALLTP